MDSSGNALARFALFAVRVTVLHILTYYIIGGPWYHAVTHRYYEGPNALPTLRNPNSDHVMKWILPAQALRGVLHAIALYPLRRALLDLGRWGGLAIASILLLIGAVAGISGVMEQLVFTTTASPEVFIATLPEIIVQTILFGYLLLWWERRLERKRQATS
jgi:hypothetical protein